MISFTGKFSHELLQQAAKLNPGEIHTGASQPDASQEKSNETASLTAAAVRARADLQWAHHLERQRAAGKTNFTFLEKWYLDKLDDDTLRKDANAATRATGHGRLRHKDGSTQVIGSVSRTVLDDYEPPLIISSDEEC
jgi:hypothetical protein